MAEVLSVRQETILAAAAESDYLLIQDYEDADYGRLVRDGFLDSDSDRVWITKAGRAKLRHE